MWGVGAGPGHGLDQLQAGVGRDDGLQLEDGLGRPGGPFLAAQRGLEQGADRRTTLIEDVVQLQEGIGLIIMVKIIIQ